MRKRDLLEIIRNGENSYVEFKIDSVSASDLARHIVAFANTDGGSILLGVNDNGAIEGITRQDIEEWAINICRNNCIPAILPFYEKVSGVEEGKDVAILKIPHEPGAVHKTNRGRWMIRVGSTSRDATTEELARLFQRRGLVQYDITAVPGTSIDELDMKRVNHYWQNILQRDSSELNGKLEDIFTNMNLMKKTGERYELTVAGILVFGKEPSRVLPQCGITAVRFKGIEMDYEMLDRKDITASLANKYGGNGLVEEDGTIDQAVKFVLRNTSTYSHLEDIRRVDTPQYRRESIRESIVNAVAHRDYTITGSKIRLFIFDDRMEVRSPGKLPNTVTLERIKHTCHFARNPEIVKFLSQHRYMEDVGLGVPNKILRLMREHSGKEPKLEVVGEEFIVTLYPYRPE